MESRLFQMIIKALFYSIIVTVVSLFGVGIILEAIFNYSSFEGSFHLPTQSLLIGLIFTVIICTMIIVEKIQNK